MKNSEIVKWWESKRKLYSIVLLIFSILILIWDYRYYTNYKPEMPYSVWNKIFLIVIWNFGANIFYSLGAGFDLSCKHYKLEFSQSVRIGLFVFGLIVSLIWTTFGISPV